MDFTLVLFEHGFEKILVIGRNLLERGWKGLAKAKCRWILMVLFFLNTDLKNLNNWEELFGTRMLLIG